MSLGIPRKERGNSCKEILTLIVLHLLELEGLVKLSVLPTHPLNRLKELGMWTCRCRCQCWGLLTGLYSRCSAACFLVLDSMCFVVRLDSVLLLKVPLTQPTLLGEEAIKCAVEYNVGCILFFAYFQKIQMLNH